MQKVARASSKKRRLVVRAGICVGELLLGEKCDTQLVCRQARPTFFTLVSIAPQEEEVAKEDDGRLNNGNLRKHYWKGIFFIGFYWTFP